MATVLIVDDDAAMREGLAETLTDLGHRVVEAGTGLAALERVAQGGIDGMLVDLRMPGLDGLEVLRRLRDGPAAGPPAAILTAFADGASTIEAIRLGAVDHLVKPVRRADLAELLGRMLACDHGGPATIGPMVEGPIVGVSAAMRAVLKTVGRIADAPATVLITGETGTGKEVIARALHDFGRRAAMPFVAVNCAAIPADLLESELFGHVRGAFTGAITDRRGSFREAAGGTLFLDEIGDMNAAMQAKILRVLQERIVTPVGGRSEPVEVRIIAATHRELAAHIAQGRFRSDLYYRLAVVPIELPPLRERLADILPLAEHFLAGRGQRLSQPAAARLMAHAWPGNVRELRNVVERAAVLARGSLIEADAIDLGPPPRAPAEPDWLEGDLQTATARLEAAMIRRALDLTQGNRAEAARRLGIHRQLLYAKLEKHGIEPTG